MSERIYASDGRFIGVTGDEKDARIAELETEVGDLRLDLADVLKKRERAEAALAERDRMLDDLAYKSARQLHNSGQPISDYEPSQELVSAVLADLRARAKEGSE